jgi:DNA polymerase-3 subunit delta
MAAPLEPAYLLLGSDRAKIRTALARLRKRFPDEAVEQWQAATTSGEDIVDACNRMGLLAEQRLHIVIGAEDWKADDVSAVLTYLDAPSPDAVLALVAGELRANS